MIMDAPAVRSSLSVLRMRWRLSPCGTFRLPEFPGSMLRGAFGRAMRDMVCSRPYTPCHRCNLAARCLFPRFFPGLGPPRHRQGQPDFPPAPFALRWDASETGRIYCGPAAQWHFECILFGDAIAAAPVVEAAWHRSAAAGLGPSRVPHHAVLEAIAGPAPLLDDGEISIPAGRIELVFETPLRLREEGTYLRRPEWPQIARAMWRRWYLLEPPHARDGLPDPEAAARGVRARWIELAWREFVRRSARHGRLLLGGVVGRLELEGDLAAALPLVRAAATIHAGKGATFGLGRVSWRFVHR
jgi:hypothetical protein